MGCTLGIHRWAAAQPLGPSYEQDCQGLLGIAYGLTCRVQSGTQKCKSCGITRYVTRKSGSYRDLNRAKWKVVKS